MNDNTSVKLKVTVVIWIIASLTGLFYYSTERLVSFDPNNELLDNSINQDFQTKLTQHLKEQFGDISGKAIHFSQDACFCNSVAQAHLSAVKSQVKENGYENQDYELSNNEFLKNFIPSTPSVALFDEAEELVFLGPYSTGYLCTAGNGFIEDLIVQMKARSQPRAIIVSLAKGCYCHNKQI